MTGRRVVGGSHFLHSLSDDALETIQLLGHETNRKQNGETGMAADDGRHVNRGTRASFRCDPASQDNQMAVYCG
ncbi:hypothetical protein VTH06DRAFT_6065 [Thermothelomyces fergusii]